MECPNCKIDIELSWERYARSPVSRFVCPECSTKFKFKRPFIWHAWFLVWTVAYFGLVYLAVSGNSVEYVWLKYAIITIIMAPIYIVIDRKLESGFETREI